MKNAVITPIEKPKIAVLGLGLELYDRVMPGLTARLQKQLERFQASLGEQAEVVISRLCYRAAHVAETVRSAEEQNLDGLLTIPLCYTASLTSVPALLRTTLPLIIWNTQEADTFTDDYDFDALLMNHVTQGTQDMTSVLIRNGRVFGMESGHYQDAAAIKNLGQWLKAARISGLARRLRVGLLGTPFKDMGDIVAPSKNMLKQWGPRVVVIPVRRFIDYISGVKPEEARTLMLEDRSRFEIAGTVSEEIHCRSSALEIALRKLIAEYRLDAFTMNFLDLVADGRCPTLPFLGINKLLAEGLGYAGEGDVLTAAHMAQMRQLAGSATFTEMYTADYVNHRIVMTHMQECNPALARRDRPVRLLAKDFWAPGIQPYIGMHFTLEPGAVTLTAVTLNARGEFGYLAYETEIRDMMPFARFDIPHWVIQLAEPAGEFLTRYSLAGGPHHLVAVPGRQAEAIRKLAVLQGFACKQV